MNLIQFSILGICRIGHSVAADTHRTLNAELRRTKKVRRNRLVLIDEHNQDSRTQCVFGCKTNRPEGSALYSSPCLAI